jgi:hypothetical protein
MMMMMMMMMTTTTMIMVIRVPQMRLSIYHERINGDRWWIYFHRRSKCVKLSINKVLSRVKCCVSHLLFPIAQSKWRDCTRLASVKWLADLSCIFVILVGKYVHLLYYVPIHRHFANAFFANCISVPLTCILHFITFGVTYGRCQYRD